MYGDLLSENFHARTTVVLVAHFTVKFFGTSVEWTDARKKKGKKKARECIFSEHVQIPRKERQNLWFKIKKRLLFPCNVPLGWRVSVTVSCDWL